MGIKVPYTVLFSANTVKFSQTINETERDIHLYHKPQVALVTCIAQPTAPTPNTEPGKWRKNLDVTVNLHLNGRIDTWAVRDVIKTNGTILDFGEGVNSELDTYAIEAAIMAEFNNWLNPGV